MAVNTLIDEPDPAVGYIDDIFGVVVFDETQSLSAQIRWAVQTTGPSAFTAKDIQRIIAQKTIGAAPPAGRAINQALMNLTKRQHVRRVYFGHYQRVDTIDQ